MAVYTRSHEEHWLCDKHEDGIVLLLEDDSMWEVHPSDRLSAAHWLRMSTIVVEHTQEDHYPYLLRNAIEKKTARANYLGNRSGRNPKPGDGGILILRGRHLRARRLHLCAIFTLRSVFVE
jgi:hypothetical protein